MPTENRPRLTTGILLGSLLFSASCLTDEGPLVRPAQYRKIATTDNQVVVAGGRTPVPMKVAVVAEDGAGVVRVGILWSVQEGPAGATLGDTLTLTDGLGTAQTSLTLGPDAGTYTVRAALEADLRQAVTFKITGINAPRVTGLNPIAFSGGDTITVAGASLAPATTFRIGGQPATVLGISVLGIGASVVVPPCLPDDSVAVTAVLLGVESAAVSGRHTPVAGTLDLVPGELISVGAAEVAGCASLPAAGPSGAEYLVVPQNVSSQTAFNYTLQNGQPPPAVPEPIVQDETFADAFHRRLREQDETLSRTRSPSGAVRKTTIPAAPVQVGQTRAFVVCDRFPCQSTDDFADVRADAMFVGRHAAIYLDRDAPEGGLSDADFAALGAVFDEQLYQVDTRAFGAESDVDENGRVVILMSPRVNGLTPKETCEESFVTGFFLAVDADPFFARDPRSNQGEIIYSFVPDPDGSVTCEHSADRVRRAVPVTFVHEFQHMINYYQHVVVRDGQSEALWLNEAMSHLAEELAGHQFRALGDNTSFTRFVLGDLLNAYNFLKAPGAVEVLGTEGTGTLQQRGAGWLFIRWLVDTHGDDVARRLSESGLRGTANVEDATRRSMQELLPEWFAANWVSDLLPDSILAPRLKYKTWEFRTTYQSLNEQAPDPFDLAFPIVPGALAPAGFSVSGSLAIGAGEYYLITQAANDPAFSFLFSPRTAGGSPAPDGARLNILRIR